MLYDESGLARVKDEALDDARGDETLLRIEVPAECGCEVDFRFDAIVNATAGMRTITANGREIRKRRTQTARQ